ncbi:ATP-dependent RNA helicase HrpA [Frigoribacterium sp. Leaf164]|uniref:ATP-dependent RNA helicase HrpA n=1 Tax=Frigoribacterium sp. Leaf164 TaxID=1736282 RepID=UPI0006F3730F|nr:ATP-dependent RNA helicase HrpA [Frigoribacterium sp. Leaf164]KQR43963.1 ATP-dependent RNA helicase HrpA [Frigoribacterium sp. Leaf164]
MSAAPLPPLTISYPAELPVSQRRDDIAAAIRDHQVVIVAGSTGSGKTTQLPKICLELGRTSIGHTQPRRIAARTISERIAEELGQEVGGLVGYQVRFTDKVSSDTKIKLMTDGILLNEIHFDRDLKRYDTIIIDEAHERSLTIDFLLGYLKQLLPRRPDLKLIITSATIDPESFSAHFDGAPIVEVSGRTYPVEIRYRPLVADDAASTRGDDDDDLDELDEAPPRRAAAPARSPQKNAPAPARADDKDYLQGINEALDELARESSGDVLVFLSGENEIRDAEDAIRGRNLPHTEVLPLYGRLSAADQHRVFQPSTTAGTRRRIVLATNVAETSLTVPGIKYVVDAGTARISRYSTRAKVQRLPIEAISQASANQRSGRSGRTSSGIAIRLYSETDFEKRPEFTEPEILRTNLAAVILQMISLGLGDIAAFPFLQPPDSRGIKDGLDLLRELGAVTQGGQITRVGKQLTRLPIDPRLARMVVESKTQGTTREVIAIVAALSIQDPRERPLERRAQADEKHSRFRDPKGDFLTLLNLFDYLEDKQKELSGNAFKRLCRDEFLNYLRVREWQDVFRQLSRAARPLGLHVGERSANPDGVHRSLLAGLLSQIGLFDPQKKDYVGARQTRFVLFPGSSLAKKPPVAIMSAELVETSRLFARVAGVIDPAWAEPLAPDLVKKSYGEPHWEKKQGAVVAYERVTLYGVPIVPRRRIQFSRIDPGYARELFIRHALVEGDWESRQAFEAKNQQLIRELTEVEERTRRRDILVDGDAAFEFFQRRIPADVTSTRDFEGWWRTAKQQTPDLLTMTAADLLGDDEPDVDEAGFPSTWRQGDQTLTLRYKFEPGADDDGVTVVVPLPLLARLRPVGFDWQVPGLRDELVTALIKSLPKQIRKNVVPAADWASKITAELPAEPPADVDEPFTATVATVIRTLTYTPVAVDDFDLERVPAHLRVSYAVVDERGRTVGVDKRLDALQERLSDDMRESVARVTQGQGQGEGGAGRSRRGRGGPQAVASGAPAANAIERSGITSWDFDELPTVVDTKHGDTVIRAYPALVDEGTSVAIRLMATPADQALETPRGVRRLLMLAVPSPVAYVQQHLTAPEKLILATSPYQNTAALFADCLVAVVDDVLHRVKPDGQLYTKKEFLTVRDRVSAAVMDSMFQTVSLVARTLTAARDADKAMKAATNMSLLAALTDMRQQRERLIYPGFVSATGLQQLQRVPVYLVGVTRRTAKLLEAPARDRAWLTEVQQATERYETAGGTFPPAATAPPALVRARWLLEEFRVSLFAQDLRPSESVSLQRIVKVLASA